MSLPLAGLRPVSPNPSQPGPSSIHEQGQSLSSARGFSEIQLERTPPPQSIGTPTTVIPAPANTTPTPETLPPSFADRHPNVTKTLASCAANIAWFVGTATSLFLYQAASPIRLFGSALSLISPKLGTSFTKTTAFKTLTGDLGREISRQAADGNRQELALLCVLDLGSVGISFSGVSAIEVGKTASKKIRSLVLNKLSNAEQRRAAEARQHQVAYLANEASRRDEDDHRENEIAQTRLTTAPAFSALTTDGQFKSLQLRGLPLTGLPFLSQKIDVNRWQDFENKHHIDTQALSLLLGLLHTGIHNTRNENKRMATIERITDVLIKCQESPEIAQQVCNIAYERGLASCTDRAATAWLAIEEFIDTAHLANQITQLTQETGPSEASNSRIQKAIGTLLTLEHKKHLSEQLKHHVDNVRHTLPGVRDYIELLLDVYNCIQKANPEALRELPYKNYSALSAGNLLHTTANQIINHLEHPEQHLNETEKASILKEFKHVSANNKEKALQKAAKINAFAKYLEKSDAWVSAFRTLNPKTEKTPEEVTNALKKAILTLDDLPLNEGDRTTLMNLFDGFRKLHANQPPTIEQLQCVHNKHTIQPAAQAKLNAIKEADTDNIVKAKKLLTEIQSLDEDFFDALAEIAMDEDSSAQIQVDQLTPFLEQVHLFLQTAFKQELPKQIVDQTQKDMISDLNGNELASARTMLKQAYLSMFSEEASEILNAFNLLTPPNNTGLKQFTQEQIITTFPKPVTLRKISNNAQG